MHKARNKSFNMKQIVNPLRTYFYSYTMSIAIGVIVFVIGIIVITTIETVFSNYIHNGYNVTVGKRIILHTCSGVFAFPFFLWGTKMFLDTYRINTIINKGKCYKGEIISYSMYGVYKRTEIQRRNRKKQVILKIQYNMKKIHFCHATGFVQNPSKVLSSKTCCIYLYNNMFFVTDFKLRKRTEPRIIIPRDN